ncbi:MAG: CheR family methyltransferase [Pseudomonadales bacterium]
MGFNLETVNLDALCQQLIFTEQEFSSFESYAIAIASLIAVHETYFLRHADQFDWLCYHWLPQWLVVHPNPQRTLRILSAGCASGEEAYSLAARLQPIMTAAGHRTLSITAMDINEKAIAKAHIGRYGLWSLRGIDVRHEQHWLDIGLRTVSVKDWVRECITFECHNLNTPLAESEPYDLILCRNMLIYMHEKAVDNILDNLHHCLASDGIILPGPSDPNPSTNSHLMVDWQDGIRRFVTKKDHLFTKEKTTLTQKIELAHHTETAHHKKASTHSSTAKHAVHELPSAALLKPYAAIESLIKSGYYMEARDLLEQRIHHNAQDTRSYVMLCMLFMDLDEIGTALEMARKAVYLEPNEPFPAYLMAVIKQRSGDEKAASHDSRWIYQQLEKLPDEHCIPFCEEITVKQLKEVLHAGF